MATTPQPTLMSLPAELQNNVCKYLSISDFGNLARVSKDHQILVDARKACHNSIMMAQDASEEAFLRSKYTNGWLLPSKTRLSRLRSPFKEQLFNVLDTSPCWMTCRARSGHGSSNFRRKLISKHPHVCSEFLKNYRKRCLGYTRWLVKNSHFIAPGIQWDQEDFYTAILLWSTVDWPGVDNVRVKVIAQAAAGESAVDRSLADLPKSLRNWLWTGYRREV